MDTARRSIRQLWRRLVDCAQRNLLRTCLFVSLALTISAARTAHGQGWQDAVQAAMVRAQGDVYGVIASLAGALLGFLLACIGVIMALFTALPEAQPREDERTPEPVDEGLKRPGECIGDEPSRYLMARTHKTRLQTLRESDAYPQLYTAFVGTTRLLGATTVTALLSLAVQPQPGPWFWPVLLTVTWLALASCLAVAVCVELLEALIEISLRDQPTTRNASGRGPHGLGIRGETDGR